MKKKFSQRSVGSKHRNHLARRGSGTLAARPPFPRPHSRTHLSLESLENRSMLAVDALEPNNNFAAASDLGSADPISLDLTIEGAGDADHFVWRAPRDGVLRIDTAFDHDFGDLDLYLYSSNLTLITFSNTVTDAERVSVPVLANQVFYFRVSEITGQLTTSYNLKLQLIEPDANDAIAPNNTIPAATNLGSGELTIEDMNIHNATDVDVYRWTAPRNGKLTVDANFLNSEGDLALQLLDINGFVLTSANGNTNNEKMVYNVTSGVPYFIRVREALGLEQPSYDLSIDFNSPPTISDIASTPGYMGGITNIPFTIGDVETPANNLTLSATSGHIGLVPTANITFSGTGTNRTMHISALPGFGAVPITVSVTDGDGAVVTDAFDLFLFLNNGEPTITQINDLAIPESTTTGALPFTIGDFETPANQLQITVTSSNTTLLPLANLVLGGSGANRTIQATPVPGLFGSSMVTLTVADLNGKQVQESFILFRDCGQRSAHDHGHQRSHHLRRHIDGKPSVHAGRP